MNYGRRQSDLIDAMASDTTQVEILPEVGGLGAFKLYVHVDGQTRFRLCKIDPKNITVQGLEKVRTR